MYKLFGQIWRFQKMYFIWIQLQHWWSLNDSFQLLIGLKLGALLTIVQGLLIVSRGIAAFSTAIRATQLLLALNLLQHYRLLQGVESEPICCFGKQDTDINSNFIQKGKIWHLNIYLQEMDCTTLACVLSKFFESPCTGNPMPPGYNCCDNWDCL